MSAGALVISLDFELHWGMRDVVPPDGRCKRHLLGAREAVPRTLALFEEFGIAATWATVGFLFARSREEMLRFSPRVRPSYRRAGLSPYTEPVGDSEEDDPLHYAPTLIDAIRRVPRQEIATHTFSHYYCLEPGQDREGFRADVESAVAIARDRGIQIRSIVHPRHQHNPEYDDVLLGAGIRSYRGNQRAWMYRATRETATRLRARGARWVDAHLGLAGPHLFSWDQVVQDNGLCNVPASLYLRPCSRPSGALARLHLRRIRQHMRDAASSGRIFHLWWHPHNFGVHVEENFAFLRGVLDEFDRCRRRDGMRSLSMHEVAEAASRGG